MKEVLMDFHTFCKNNQKFQLDSDPMDNSSFSTIELTKYLYADCYLNHRLNCLLSKHISNDYSCIPLKWKGDLNIAFKNLFLHYPVCNFIQKEERRNPKFSFDMKCAISNCSKWFFILYSYNFDICYRLFPVITFILGDSYEYIKDKEHSIKPDHFNMWLYDFISDNLQGKYQMPYLFSLLSGSVTKKYSCISHGSKVISSLKKHGIKIFMNPHSSVMPPKIDDKPIANNAIELNAKNLMDLLSKCQIRNTFSSYNSDRIEYYTAAVTKSEIVKNAYYSDPPLFGENFIAFLLYLQDFGRNISPDNHWSKYDHALTMYAINKMTQWITPFTTRTEFCLMPAYNALHPLACNYLNKYMKQLLSIKEQPRGKYVDFESAFNPPDPSSMSAFIERYKDLPSIPVSDFTEYFKGCFEINWEYFAEHFKHKDTLSITEFSEYFQDADEIHISLFIEFFNEAGLLFKCAIPYMNNFYIEFQSWYEKSSNLEQDSFDSFLTDSANALFNQFIRCENDAVFLPTNKHLREGNKQIPFLGYYYCLCDNLTFNHIANPAL